MTRRTARGVEALPPFCDARRAVRDSVPSVSSLLFLESARGLGDRLERAPGAAARALCDEARELEAAFADWQHPRPSSAGRPATIPGLFHLTRGVMYPRAAGRAGSEPR